MSTNIPMCLQGNCLLLVFEGVIENNNNYDGEQSNYDDETQTNVKYVFSQAFFREDDACDHLNLIKSLKPNYSHLHRIVPHIMSKRNDDSSSFLYWKEELGAWVFQKTSTIVTVKDIANSLGFSV